MPSLKSSCFLLLLVCNFFSSNIFADYKEPHKRSCNEIILDKGSSTDAEYAAKMCCENIKPFVFGGVFITGLGLNIVAYAVSPVLLVPSALLWVTPFVLAKGVDNPFVTIDYYKRREHRSCLRRFLL